MRRYLSASLIVCALCGSFAGCGARRTPNLQRIFAEARKTVGKRPIIVIPGILGSQLVNKETGEVAWPSAFRSSVDGLSLPIGPDLQANRDNLVAKNIVDTIRLARLVPEVYIYHRLLEALKTVGGYNEGKWDNPPAGGDRDTYYVFAYDWRRDNVETARELVRKIDGLKNHLNRPDLKFNIVAHSMGGLVARYAAMYGDADLPADEVAPSPTWAGAAHINKIFMFGTPNEGSAEAFQTLLDGYSITEGLRRRVRLLNKLSREDALTTPALYQLLPHRSTVRFLNDNLEPIEIDLYDPATWRRYNWAAFGDAKYRSRFVNGEMVGDDPPSKQRSLKNLDEYFEAVLHRALRFHEALDATYSMESPVKLFAFGGDCEETLSAPIVYRDEKKNVWVTVTTPREVRGAGGRRFSKDEVTRAMYIPGDGRVTRRSLLGESLAERGRKSVLFNSGLPVYYAVFACDLHGELQSNETLQDNALTALVNEAIN